MYSLESFVVTLPKLELHLRPLCSAARDAAGKTALLTGIAAMTTGQAS